MQLTLHFLLIAVFAMPVASDKHHDKLKTLSQKLFRLISQEIDKIKDEELVIGVSQALTTLPPVGFGGISQVPEAKVVPEVLTTKASISEQTSDRVKRSLPSGDQKTVELYSTTSGIPLEAAAQTEIDSATFETNSETETPSSDKSSEETEETVDETENIIETTNNPTATQTTGNARVTLPHNLFNYHNQFHQFLGHHKTKLSKLPPRPWNCKKKSHKKTKFPIYIGYGGPKSYQ
uniref:Uncharacterized protein n=1 Tax=Caenorhabditis japonica TaxID=281687 RepID=A0A8R1HYU6_CAEJA